MFSNNRFFLVASGSVTCHGKRIENANCPMNQYMIIKTASYRGLNTGQSCGSSDNHNSSVDVTCAMKRYCNGLHECNITVDDTSFPGGDCPGLTKYLYFEYQCSDTSTPFIETCQRSGE